MKKNMPVWLFRCNYVDLGSRIPQYKDVSNLYEHNRCPITILSTETWDKFCYDKLLDGKKEEVSWEEYVKDHPNAKKANISSYIYRFVDLAKEVKQQDVLVVLEYKDDGKGARCKYEKIGIIRKGSKIETYQGNNYELFYFELAHQTVITIPKNGYKILNGLIPSNVTLGSINNRENAINEFYHFIKDNTPINLELQNLPNEKIEDLCCEWLRSSHASENKLEKVYVANGELNFPVLDIMGKTFKNQVLAAQVSYTESYDIIISKVQKLLKIDTDLHLMFTKLTDNVFEQKCKKGEKMKEVKHISLEKVWDDLFNDKEGKIFIEELFKESYNNNK